MGHDPPARLSTPPRHSGAPRRRVATATAAACRLQRYFAHSGGPEPNAWKHKGGPWDIKIPAPTRFEVPESFLARQDNF